MFTKIYKKLGECVFCICHNDFCNDPDDYAQRVRQLFQTTTTKVNNAMKQKSED